MAFFWLKPATIAALLVASSLQPTELSPLANASLWQYAITQGGLLVVVLVLLWSYRKDSMGALLMKDAHLTQLIEIVRTNQEAMTKNSEAIVAQAKSIDSFANALNRLSDRRGS